MITSLRLFVLFGLFSLYFATHAKAESETSAYQYVAGNGQINFSAGGAAALPQGLLTFMRSDDPKGGLSPIMQFVLMNNMMTQCILSVEKAFPQRRDAYVIANAKFNAGFCRVRKCFEQAMLLQTLSQMSGNAKYGGSPEQASQDAAQKIGQTLIQGFQKEDVCSQGSPAIDPGLIAAFK